MATSAPQWIFDENYWAKAIGHPDWYTEFVPYAKKIREQLAEGSEELEQFNKTVRHFLERALEDGRVALADHGPNLDTQRQPIDTIVIHHTSAKPGYRLTYMNATQLLNVYAPYFMNPTVREERNLKGTPIWSGHLKEGKQVFYLYHWLMRMDGTFERLLDDSQIGWHAGDWETNKRSVGICLDNDYEKMCPTNAILKTLANHIRKNYPQIKVERIIGHREVKADTTCPGAHFLSEWKPLLLGLIA
jgi:hypothetical protein